MTKVTECPCASLRPYAACCRPYHRAEREAETPEKLMRSRYAAYAMREIDYLVRTTHTDHEDHALPPGELARRIRHSASSFKYMGLAILDRRDADADGIAQVLFLARVFEKGKDRSFVELSDFAHDGEGWRYLCGTLIPISEIKGDPEALRIATFPR